MITDLMITTRHPAKIAKSLVNTAHARTKWLDESALTSLEEHSRPLHGVKKSVKTVEKWVAHNDKALSTMTWLVFERADGNQYHMVRLKCSCVRGLRTSWRA